MAGAGYKLFNTGDVLTAAQVNTYLNEQTVMVFASSAARTSALSGVLAEGMVSYLQDTNAVEVYNGSAWVGLAADQTPLTTKGDLFTFTTVDARLGVGANGTVLTADSSEATGLKWAAPAAASFVGCRIYKTGAAQTLSNATLTDLTFGAESFDTDGFHDNVTNNERITIPAGKGGKYLLVGVCELASNSTGRRQTIFKKNGTTTIHEVFIAASTAVETTFNSTAVVSLVASDYVTFQVRQDSGGNLNTGSGEANVYFAATYLGA